MLNLVSHCNNETTHCLPDDTMIKYTLSYHGVSQGFVHTEALVSEDDHAPHDPLKLWRICVISLNILFKVWVLT